MLSIKSGLRIKVLVCGKALHDYESAQCSYWCSYYQEALKGWRRMRDGDGAAHRSQGSHVGEYRDSCCLRQDRDVGGWECVEYKSS